jgi:hypothetical protein
MRIKAVCPQSRDRAVARAAEDVQKGESGVACQGPSVKKAKWWGEIQLNGREISAAEAKASSIWPRFYRFPSVGQTEDEDNAGRWR